MGLENCPVCGQVFNKTTRVLCTPCWDREQGLFDVVSVYVYEHNDAEAPEVIENTGVTHADLEYLLKRGRLLGFERLVATVLRCERCNESITRGQYCRRCVTALVVEGKDPLGNPPAPDKNAKRDASSPSVSRGQIAGSRADYWRSRSKR